MASPPQANGSRHHQMRLRIPLLHTTLLTSADRFCHSKPHTGPPLVKKGRLPERRWPIPRAKAIGAPEK
jgi:hypothetical protein